MSDPIDPLEGEPRRDVNPTRSADPIQPSWLTAPYADERYLVPDKPEPVVHQERLFSRRVLFGWAFATLVVVTFWFIMLPVLSDRAGTRSRNGRTASGSVGVKVKRPPPA